MDAPQQPDPAPDPPAQPTPVRAKTTARTIGTGIVGLGLLAAKYLFLFGKIFAFSWTFLLSLWLYVLVFGWRFAIVILLTLLVHELGHYFAFRSYGLPARLPQFVPFLGAYTMGTPSEDPEHNAYIALAGPFTGLALASICYTIGIALHDPFWIAVADISALLNLFNLLPIPPFDGGRVAAVIWARGTRAPETMASRVRVGVFYIATALGLFLVLMQAHVATPPGAPSVW